MKPLNSHESSYLLAASTCAYIRCGIASCEYCHVVEFIYIE